MAITKVSTGLIEAGAASVNLNIDENTLYIDVATNRVGVGNTNPATALDVTGTVTADGLTVDGGSVNNDSAAIAGKFNANGNEHIRLEISTDSTIGNQAALDLISNSNTSRIFTTGSTGLKFSTDGGTTSHLVIDGSGNVGIGTASPSGKLDINISTNARGYFSSTIGEVGSGNFALQVVDATGAALKPLGFRAEDIRFATGASERLRIHSNGTISTPTVGGTNNVRLGEDTLASASLTASYNTAVGYQAAYSNTTGINTAIGQGSLFANTTGTSNTALGKNALGENATANNNTAVGYQSLYNTGAVQTAGAFETGIVYTIQTTGTTDFTLIGAANSNPGTVFTATGAGTGTGTASPNSASNVALGHAAGYSNLTSSDNVFIGEGSGYYVTSASNTFVGKDAGVFVTTGAKNTILGRFNGNQGLDIRTTSNNIVLSDGDGAARVVVQKGNDNKTSIISSTGIARVGGLFPVSVADGSTVTLTDVTAGSMLICVYDQGTGDGGVYHATYKGQTKLIESDGSYPFATTDTVSSWCVYKASNSHTVTFKNNTGATRGMIFGIFGAEPRAY